MHALALFVAAAIAEIAGCYAFWMSLRLGRSALWIAPGVVCRAIFAWLLTRVEAQFAGRAFAAYGGVYIVASLCWMGLVEASRPDRWDALGAALCLAGALLILFGPRAAA